MTLKRARHDEAGMELPPRTTASALLTSGCRKMMPPRELRGAEKPICHSAEHALAHKSIRA